MDANAENSCLGINKTAYNYIHSFPTIIQNNFTPEEIRLGMFFYIHSCSLRLLIR